MITYPNKLQKVTLFGGCEQNGTPTPDNPVDIVCNNGVLKVDSQGNIYTDGIQEVVTDSLGNTANAERLLGAGDYKDTQSVLDGVVTRNVGIKVLDGTEDWHTSISTYNGVNRNNFFMLFDDAIATGEDIINIIICSIAPCVGTIVYVSSYSAPICKISSTKRFNIVPFEDTTTIPNSESWKQYLADQYANGTPVIVVYPLLTPTTEQVTPQPLAGSSATVTAGSIDNLPIESSTIAELKKRCIGDKEVKRVYVGNNLVWKNN